MFAEAVWKQIEKKALPADAVVDTAQVRALGARLDDALLGRLLFELTAAARMRSLDPEGALRRQSIAVMAAVEREVAGKDGHAVAR
jgi:XTP/dITP diphosphohydrolase/tetrapyrrole methylase family protein/MazG family protein